MHVGAATHASYDTYHEYYLTAFFLLTFGISENNVAMELHQVHFY